MMRAKKFAVVSLLFLFSAEGAFAATTTPQTNIENATVNLYCRIKASRATYSATGSGVFIHDGGIILTNAHVAQYFLLATGTGRMKTTCSVRTGSPAREQYEASLIYLSPSWAHATIEATTDIQPRTGGGEYDFALLRVTAPDSKTNVLPERFSALPLDVALAFLDKDEQVVVAGYPSEGLEFKEIKRKLPFSSATSTITAIRTFARTHADVLALSPSAANAHGVSGGPVVRSWGGLVGIATAVGNEDVPPEERTMRAITLYYIDRVLREETGRSIFNHITDGSLGEIDPTTSPFVELRKTIEKTLRNTRE